MNKISTILGACSLSIFMSGCATNPDNVESDLMLNQPSVSDVVAVGEQQDRTATKVSTAPVQVAPVVAKVTSTPAVTNSNAAEVEPQIDRIQNEAVVLPAKAAPLSIQSSIDETDVATYVLMRGETYRNALNRWLYDEKYTKVGMLLSEEYEWKINQTVKVDEVITSTFENALISMKTRIAENIQPQDTSLFKAGFEPLEVIDPVSTSTLTFQLNQERGEAIITTSILPVTLFEVQKGDLMTNYITMAHHYGWNADPDFYLTANMESPFSYIIVTEEQNIRGAFEQLLKPYPSLRAGLYEPTRQIFIQDDK